MHFLRFIPDIADVVDFNFGLGPDQPPTSAIFKPELQRNLLYKCSPEEDFTLASMLLRPGPLMVLLGAKFEGDNSGKVDKVNRVYIKTAKDEVLKLENQELLIKKWPPNEVMSIDTDHSPFFSKPNELHKLLLKASTMYCG
ncbi:hypothetical protein AMTR_s00077p00130740 [Amborella trichopoda]|uniref:AB hydrolase-1 domain-containing protein n=1 Tax=Amborella trichopoda TaxID=13333 RepID=W1P981_AMBTC|nr:hypothetical protein AMTR_s00077p00130740 [Amborella trichopoda]